MKSAALCVAMALALAAPWLGAAPAAAQSEARQTPPEPSTYRLDTYRAPTPATLAGARVIDTQEAHRLWTERAAIFADVLPQAPRPANLPESVVWRDKPRFDLPGSLWLADTGYGELAPQIAGYFADGLTRATGGDKQKPIVLYCQRDCWMSWNAAKRALTLGYSNVIWYPEGSDGWQDAGYPLEERHPEPRP